MESLIIKSTDYTPGICFDPAINKFEMVGESRPENVKLFYVPVLQWMESYSLMLQQNPDEALKIKKLVLEFKIKYFNSTSAKFILTIFGKFDELHRRLFPVTVNWYYNDVDIEMKETGEEFEKMLNMNFNYISYNGN